jgi:hypothetical protein
MIGEGYEPWREIGPPTARDVILDPEKFERYSHEQLRAALDAIQPEVDEIIDRMKGQTAVDRMLGAVAALDLDTGTEYLLGVIPSERAERYYRLVRERNQTNEGEL